MTETDTLSISTLGNRRAVVYNAANGNLEATHHKAIVIDDQTVIIGSLNFSSKAIESNDENVVIVTNFAIAQEYLGEFEKRWAEAKDLVAADLGC